jgi:hypothetical protein
LQLALDLAEYLECALVRNKEMVWRLVRSTAIGICAHATLNAVQARRNDGTGLQRELAACYPQDKGPYLSLAFPALITRQHGFGYGPHLEVGSTWAARSRMISYGRPTVSVSVPTLRAIAALTRPSGMRGTPPDRRCATLLFPSSCAALSRLFDPSRTACW